jgi:hypothetical protein
MTTPPADPPEGDLGDRVERLETGQSSIIAKLDQLLTGPAKPKDDELDASINGRPGTVAEQVQAELKRRDDEAAAKATADADKAERQTLRERLAKLAEAPPVRPVPRRERLMWGKQ